MVGDLYFTGYTAFSIRRIENGEKSGYLHFDTRSRAGYDFLSGSRFEPSKRISIGKYEKELISVSSFYILFGFLRFELLGDLHNAARAEALRAELDEVLGILDGGNAARSLDLDGGSAMRAHKRHIVKGRAAL